MYFLNKHELKLCKKYTLISRLRTEIYERCPNLITAEYWQLKKEQINYEYNGKLKI